LCSSLVPEIRITRPEHENLNNEEIDEKLEGAKRRLTLRNHRVATLLENKQDRKLMEARTCRSN